MTPTQRRIYNAVRKIGKDGWSVTVREVCDAVELSPPVVHGHLTKLTEAGHLMKHPRSSAGGWRVAS